MTQDALRPVRLLAATIAVAAGIAGFALGDTAPAGATPPVHTPISLAVGG